MVLRPDADPVGHVKRPDAKRQALDLRERIAPRPERAKPHLVEPEGRRQRDREIDMGTRLLFAQANRMHI